MGAVSFNVRFAVPLDGFEVVFDAVGLVVTFEVEDGCGFVLRVVFV